MNMLLARGILALLALFTGLIAGVRLLPRADYPLRQLVMPPPDCAMPCWQGIHPGETSYQTAIDLLASNRYIVELDTRQTTYAGSRQFTWYIYWMWRDDSGEAITGSMMIRNDIVQMIRINRVIPFGLLWEMLGQPDMGSFVGTLIYIGSEARNLPLYHTAIYQRSGITIQTGASCGRFWWQPSMLTVGGAPQGGHVYDVSKYRNFACKGWAM